MKSCKRILTLFMCCALLCGTLSFGTSALTADDAWQGYFGQYMQDGGGFYMAPGADEHSRNISWYAPDGSGECYAFVSLSRDMSRASKYLGQSEPTPEGDVRCRVTLPNLEPGQTYYYQYGTGKQQSEIYSFSTDKDDSFTAMYVTDIHVSKEDDDEDALMNQSYTFSEVIAEANAKTPVDLIVSAGDQASRGYRSEYTALVASPLLHSIPFALCVGNHDRKGIAYKFFTNNPNEYRKASVHALISYDYWYVKGDVLFLVFDSNVASMTEHRRFIKEAIQANPDVTWRVATFHHDLYGQRIPRREDENKLLRTIWSPIMDEFRLDLVLLGHSHYFTISNPIFANKSNGVLDPADGSVVNDPKGTIVMVSGSINRPRSVSEDEELPLGENIAYDYLTDQPIYNLLDCTAESITVRSYALGADEPFHTFTISKSTQQGGHPEDGRDWYDGFVRFVADVYGFFNEAVTSARMRLNWKDFVNK